MKVDDARLRAAVRAEEIENGWPSSVWFETTPEDPGQAAARAALAQHPAVVIVAGGDGTIRSVAEELHSTGVPVAVVAAGTGNLFARNLGLMGDVDAAVHTGFTGATRTIDVGVVELNLEHDRVERHVFLVMTGVGLDARMATGTNRLLKERIGWLAYADPISRSVLGDKQFVLHYRVDGGKESATLAHTVIVGNCGTLTAGLLLLPDAQIDDGLLDVVLLRPKGFWQWLRVGSRLGIAGLLHRTRRGRIVLRAAADLRALRYVQARTLSARFDQPQSIQLDGDSFGMVVAATITVLPQALAVRVPAP